MEVTREELRKIVRKEVRRFFELPENPVQKEKLWKQILKGFKKMASSHNATAKRVIEIEQTTERDMGVIAADCQALKTNVMAMVRYLNNKDPDFERMYTKFITEVLDSTFMQLQQATENGKEPEDPEDPGKIIQMPGGP